MNSELNQHPDGKQSDGPPPSGPLPEGRALADALRLSFAVLRVVMIVLLLLTLMRSSLFVVPQQQRAFVLRFGRITGHGDARIRGPGPHLAFPAPIDEIVRLPGEQMLTVRSDSFDHGLDEADSGGLTLGQRRRPFFNAVMTSDRNLLHAQWTLRYTVVLPDIYVFGFDDMQRLLRHELDRAVLLAAARTDVDRALRADREWREAVHLILNQRIDALGLGVRIHQVEVDRISPPPAVAGAFDNVIMAEQQSNELVSQARIEAARIVGEARGRAAARLADARGAAARLTEKAAADAATLSEMLTVGLDAPDNLLSTVLRLDRVSRILAGERAPRIIRLRPAPDRREIRLLLGGESPVAAD